MRISDLAMMAPEEGDEAEDVDADGAAMFEDAATEAFELFKAGKPKEAAASLKSAIEACVADYMAEE